MRTRARARAQAYAGTACALAERATLALRPQTVLPPAWLSVVQGSSPLEMDGCVYNATASFFFAYRPCQPQRDGK